MTPAAIRKAAHAVAIEGAAGRKAARIAVEAAAADQTMGLLTRFHLVTHLLEEAGVERIDWRGFSGDDHELRTTIKGYLAQVAPKMDSPADGLFEQIEVIADIATPVGPPLEGSVSRNAAMLGRLQTLVLSLRQWAAGEGGGATADAGLVIAVAERTLREATVAQQRARDLLQNVMAMLRAWRQPGGDQLRACLIRPEWLLDGWGQICGLWESVARDERAVQREMLQQIKAALPMLDPNDRGTGAGAETADVRFDRGRRVKLHEDWRTGASVIDGPARAELLRAANA